MLAWPVIATIVIFVFGLVILALASNYLVTAIVKIAKVIRMPSFVIGAVILAVATSIPEFMNNLMAAFKGVIDLGVGNLIGAAIVDITLAVGLLYLIAKPAKVKDKTSSRLLLLTLVPLALFLLFGWNNMIGRLEGFVFLAIYGGTQFYLLRKGWSKDTKAIAARKLLRPYMLVPLAIFSIILGAFLVVDTGEAMAMLAGLSPAVIGLTLTSIGTTMPEIVSSVIGAVRNEIDEVAGTVIGGMMVNLALILGLMAVIFTLPINFSAFWIPALILIGLIIFYVAYTELRGQTDRILGGVLVASFVAYMVLNFV